MSMYGKEERREEHVNLENEKDLLKIPCSLSQTGIYS
jgi:hypothetical protein